MSDSEPNHFHVMHSHELGERIHYPWLTKALADKLAAVLNEIETDRQNRFHARDRKPLLTEPVQDYYVVNETPEQCRQREKMAGIQRKRKPTRKPA